jgi:excisionase family DNA binding protein
MMQTPFEKLRFYTAAEVAEVLRLNHQVLARKLQAGEIPAYKIGKDWRIEEGELRTWLRHSANQPPDSGDREEDVIRRHFFEGGRLKQIPGRRSKRAVVLRMLARSFEPGRRYSEKEVSETLAGFHPDFATLRRELIMAKLLQRAGGEYWRASEASRAEGEPEEGDSTSSPDAS